MAPAAIRVPITAVLLAYGWHCCTSETIQEKKKVNLEIEKKNISFVKKKKKKLRAFEPSVFVRPQRPLEFGSSMSAFAYLEVIRISAATTLSFSSNCNDFCPPPTMRPGHSTAYSSLTRVYDP